jgi:Gpi18-like mannosyltransferase
MMKARKKHQEKFSLKFEPQDVALIGIAVGLALALRLPLFWFQSGDFVTFLDPWTSYIRAHGYFHALKDNFANYAPPYLYLLVASTYLPMSSLSAIKLISVIFDFALATCVLFIVKSKYDARAVWLAAFCVTLFAPSVFFNSALWAQCDSIYTAFLLAAIYFIISRQPTTSMLSLALAFSFKAQAVFLFPLFFILFLKKLVPLKTFLLIPLVYLVLILPSWALGRPFIELLSIYRNQSGAYDMLTLRAPNFYQWLPDNKQLFETSGIIFALALVSVLLVPYALPHMHERYFFPADVISIIYAFYFPRRFYVPIVIGFVSLFSYFPFLFVTEPISMSHLAFLLTIILVIVIADLIKSLYPHAATVATTMRE